ncbi:urocanate hydratase [Bacillus sp. REN16]|uniref:urocanate hydratase n=1 Tax=Bacillus sp. REN16 TaxID=2887296 RepID=UPI001E4C9F4E|nr:urocanate hydratase [Bacillus sp. REN16]MCC3359159.1 urocanate hydratase [Bacillus sp. REN16]
MRCKSWLTEGILRMLENTLNNGERPQDLVIYGGTGKVARNWDSFYLIVDALKNLNEDETLIVQSGKPVAVLKTHRYAPRVMIANAHLVKSWETFGRFLEMEKQGLMMNGMFTAGSWCYIGTQGILQGTYETFAACAKKDFEGSMKGRIVLTGGLGGMGGAQPLAVKLLGGVCLVAEIDKERIKRRLETGYCDTFTESIEEAIQLAIDAKEKGEAKSIAILGNAADVFSSLYESGFRPDIVTDQTSAHDPLYGYIPSGYSVETAKELRTEDPDGYIEKAKETIVRHIDAMVRFKDDGVTVFEYGNFIRYQAEEAGYQYSKKIKGFVVEYIRPHFCEGRGPFRWICLSGDVEDLRKTEDAIMEAFPENQTMINWIQMARKVVPIEGLPARICWLSLGERAKFGKIVNDLYRRGELKGPVAFSRDHLDTGSVTMPNRETEGMKDGTDGVADWPILNALLNTSGGADLVAVHGSAGMNSEGWMSSGLIVIADGTDEAEAKIERCLTNDPAIGVVRHFDAGYEKAIETAEQFGLKIPGQR